MTEHLSWVKVASYGSGFEAEIAIAKLRSGGVYAITRGHDVAGVYGYSFQGPTPWGVDVMVASDEVDEANDILADTALEDDPSLSPSDRVEQ